jgi:deoxyinosine 3'endonuclease (endonuclease V)
MSTDNKEQYESRLHVHHKDAEHKRILRVKDFSQVAVLIDKSGSTQSPPLGTSISFAVRDVLRQEIALAKEFTNAFLNPIYKVIVWDTNATAVEWSDESEKIYPSGGTYPSRILRDSVSNVILRASEIVLFMTDGEISQGEVTNFANSLKDLDMKTLIVCVLYSSRDDISVFSPFFDMPKLLVVSYDLRLLHSRGIDKWKTGSKITIDELINLELHCPIKIPFSHVILKDDENVAISVEFDALSFLPCAEVRQADWTAIATKAKTLGKISELYNSVSNWKKEDCQELYAQLNNRQPSALEKKKRNLIEQIMRARESGNNYSELSAELHALNETEDDHQVELRQLQILLRERMQFWDQVYSILSHYQQATYSLNSFVYSSNRVNRAKVLGDGEIEEIQIAYDWYDSPTISCSICLSDGPAVIWFCAPEDKTVLLSDFMLNTPLVSAEVGMKIIRNPVCGQCAQEFASSFSHSVYREPISFFVPLNWDKNIRLVNTTLFTYLSDKKVLPHVKMAFVAHLDDLGEDKLKNLVGVNVSLQSMLQSIRTTNTFDETGQKVSLMEAISTFPLKEDDLFRQPLSAASRLMKWRRQHFSVTKEEFGRWMELRQTFAIVEEFCQHSKHDYAFEVDFLTSLIFNDSCCGLPEISIHSDEDITIPFKYRKLDLLAFRPESVLAVLFVLYWNTQTHQRPQALFSELRPLLDLRFRSLEEIKTHIVMEMVGQYPDEAKTDTRTPVYSFYNGDCSGPSKFYFIDELLIKEPVIRDKVPDFLQDQVASRLRAIYGSNSPAPLSGPVPLHRTVARILESDFKDETAYKPEILITCIKEYKRTCGLRGNPFRDRLVDLTIYCIVNFLDLRNKARASNLKLRLSTDRQSFSSKVFDELYAYGINEQVLTPELISEKIPTPESMDTKYAHIDTKKLKAEANQMYFTSQGFSSLKSGIKSLYLQEVLEVNLQSHIQDYTSAWAQEQKEIVAKVNMADTKDFDNITYLAGCDISFNKEDDAKQQAGQNVSVRSVASFAIFNRKTRTQVAEISINCRTNIPYKAGFLAFREAPLLMQLLEKLKEEMPEYMPELIVMDGNGTLHPRRCGVSTHFSVLSGIPCLGVSKSVLYVENITREEMIRQQEEANSKEGDFVDIFTASGERICSAFNMTGFPKNARYVNVGSGISLETAKKITKEFSMHKDNELIRQADHASRLLVSSWKNE